MQKVKDTAKPYEIEIVEINPSHSQSSGRARWFATHQQRKIDHQGRHAELPLECVDGIRDVDSITEVLSDAAR